MTKQVDLNVAVTGFTVGTCFPTITSELTWLHVSFSAAHFMRAAPMVRTDDGSLSHNDGPVWYCGV